MVGAVPAQQHSSLSSIAMVSLGQPSAACLSHVAHSQALSAVPIKRCKEEAVEY